MSNENVNQNGRQRGKEKEEIQVNKEEVELLLSLWTEKLPQLRGIKRNSHVYKDMSMEMAAKGFIYSANEIRVKIHNLTNKYREERKIVGPSGGSPSTCEYYININGILDSYKSFNLVILVEDSTVYEVVECALSSNNFSIDSQDCAFSRGTCFEYQNSF
ncbi:uncharacterized protein LOC105220452 isoform X2 [Zeugodacus cucurbitae]|uniref:uncharacterized protein LOC105220452 isoform X2 n=1 Tax=Zeugodacus cucurbitae TaxID=28588 RepID=UPI0023D8FA43|nr:uncharacterized protein LOC105220452 isoform X2 [Zeugodacus cucurbitae]